MSEPRLSIDDPGQLFAAIPALLGFCPSDSIVVIMVNRIQDAEGEHVCVGTRSAGLATPKPSRSPVTTMAASCR
ncbi:DUF4192 family protein [Nocardia terpenica]|uniref:DUF4192 family protein n=1 Tax=Nocardia terpenica TaxID=455432 RepID=A0A6G9Z246_9NOCA|nr:DUF4192 family protein [Nocardia terpenica]QIS19552.1 DUF4192 family protein [Nocardia terpenica]